MPGPTTKTSKMPSSPRPTPKKKALQQECSHLQVEDQVKVLQELQSQLESLRLELTTVESERDQQREHLEQLHQEAETLANQSEQRVIRTQLDHQRTDLQQEVDRKLYRRQVVLEEMERTKTRHRQLKRTLRILQAGVQDIIDQSTQDDDPTIDGARRAAKRQEIIQDLLKKYSPSNFLDAPSSRRNQDESEADDIEEDEDERVAGVFIRRIPSINRPKPPANDGKVGRPKTGSSEARKDKQRSKKSSSSGSQGASRSRPSAQQSQSSKNKARSRSSSKSKSPTSNRGSSKKRTPSTKKSSSKSSNGKGKKVNAGTTTSKPGSLGRKLAGSQQGLTQDDDISQATPKTCNTK